jgi:sulfopyruvate decarboxylase TPP-binding subunit
MFTGREIVGILEQLGVSHVIWVPDSTFGTWEADLEASGQLELLRVSREGEAWPLAAGLLVGGKSPIIMMQTTGLFESGDAMRNVLFDLQVPLFAIIGIRNWLIEESRDSARRFAEPIVNAWSLNQVWIAEEPDKPRLEEHYTICQQVKQAGVVLMAEGKG